MKWWTPFSAGKNLFIGKRTKMRFHNLITSIALSAALALAAPSLALADGGAGPDDRSDSGTQSNSVSVPVAPQSESLANVNARGTNVTFNGKKKSFVFYYINEDDAGLRLDWREQFSLNLGFGFAAWTRIPYSSAEELIGELDAELKDENGEYYQIEDIVIVHHGIPGRLYIAGVNNQILIDSQTGEVTGSSTSTNLIIDILDDFMAPDGRVAFFECNACLNLTGGQERAQALADRLGVEVVAPKTTKNLFAGGFGLRGTPDPATYFTATPANPRTAPNTSGTPGADIAPVTAGSTAALPSPPAPSRPPSGEAN